MRTILATGSRQRGFTLLELMVVMAILVLIAMAVPQVWDRSLPGRRVARATSQLIAAIQDVQSASVLAGKPVGLRLEQKTLSASERFVRIGTFPSSTTIVLTDLSGRPAHEVVAYPDGSALGGRFEIVDGKHKSFVILSSLTGRIHVIRS